MLAIILRFLKAILPVPREERRKGLIRLTPKSELKVRSSSPTMLQIPLELKEPSTKNTQHSNPRKEKNENRITRPRIYRITDTQAHGSRRPFVVGRIRSSDN